MYEAYYGFNEKPFSLLPDPGFLYPSKRHRLALMILEYGLMNEAGLIVVSGAIGSGKTTMIRHLLNKVDENLTIGLVSNTHRSFGEFLQWVLMAYGLDYSGKDKVSAYQAFVEFLIQQYGEGKRTVLIVDEAQNMSPEALEELRMLSNINADKDMVLQMVLVGQPELREVLQRPELTQFAQRVGAEYHLEGMNAEDTAAYIRHRLKVAGGDPQLFDERACQEVYEHSGGVPRLINLLCDTALIYAFADDRGTVDAKLIRDVAREKQRGGFFPVTKKDSTKELA